MERTDRKNVLMQMIRKYGYLMMIGAIVVTLAIVLAFNVNKGDTLENKDINVDNTPATEVKADPVVFTSPLKNLVVLKDYSSSKLMYNKTLKQWEAHKAIDFEAADGEDVFAVYKGTVSAIDNDYLCGTVITIDHGDGIQTRYGSLSQDVSVKVGDNVTTGQKIGMASNTAKNSSKDGVHLRFEVLKDGVKVDPNDYITIANK